MIKKKPIECTFCEKFADREMTDDLDFFSNRNKKIYLCEECLRPFNAGSILGQVQLNNKILALILSGDDDSCLADLKEKISEYSPSSKDKMAYSPKANSLSPVDFYEYLNKRVIGQDNAKKRISLAVFEHLRSLRNSKVDKNNILLLGPSGSGKTLIVNSISRSLDIPYVLGDATSFSPTGFEGADAETMIADLLNKTEGDVEMAEKGLVFIDEIDKLAIRNSVGTRLESFNYATQSTLLKLIEGKRVKINVSGSESPQPPKMVDTTKMLFCFGGAFTGLEEIVAKKIGHAGKLIGFRQETEQDYDSLMKSYEIYDKTSHDVMVESLVEYGLTTELVGRIQTIVALKPLSKDEMLSVLNTLEDSPLRKNKILFAESNIEVDYSEDFIDAVVDKAIKTGTGTRALNSIVKTSISGAAFKFLGSNSQKRRIIFTKECINDPMMFVEM